MYWYCRTQFRSRISIFSLYTVLYHAQPIHPNRCIPTCNGNVWEQMNIDKHIIHPHSSIHTDRRCFPLTPTVTEKNIRRRFVYTEINSGTWSSSVSIAVFGTSCRKDLMKTDILIWSYVVWCSFTNWSCKALAKASRQRLNCRIAWRLDSWRCFATLPTPYHAQHLRSTMTQSFPD